MFNYQGSVLYCRLIGQLNYSIIICTYMSRCFFHLFYFHLFRGFGFRLVVFQPLPCESPSFRSRPQEYCPSAILLKPIIYLNNMSFFHHRKRFKSMMRIRTFRIAKKHTPLFLPNTAILQQIKGLKPSICAFLHSSSFHECKKTQLPAPFSFSPAVPRGTKSP